MTPEVISKLEEAYLCNATDLEACFFANISKDTLYRYMKKHPEFSERKAQLKNSVKFQAKRNVKAAIDKGDIQQSNYVLDRLAKSEGYTTRTELTGAEGKDLSISVINYGNNSPSQLPAKELPTPPAPSS